MAGGARLAELSPLQAEVQTRLQGLELRLPAVSWREEQGVALRHLRELPRRALGKADGVRAARGLAGDLLRPGRLDTARNGLGRAVKAQLGVYCDPAKRCPVAQGRQNGFILLWTRGRTRIQMDSAHLALAGLLRVARSLTPVR